MEIIKYIRRILGIPKKFNFNRLEGKMLEPAKLSGGGFIGVGYPEAFKSKPEELAIITDPFEHDRLYEFMGLLESLSLNNYNQNKKQ